MSARPAEETEDIGRELAQWLCEVGHRVPATEPGARPESPEELLRYLAELAGRPLRSREDIHRYFTELHAERLAAIRALERRRLWRESLLIALLATAYLQFYFLDIHLEIAKLPRVVPMVMEPSPAGTG